MLFRSIYTMDSTKKRGLSEKRLSTIVKTESLELTMRHQNLLKAERSKDGKSFVLYKVNSEVLVPRIDLLIRLNMFWGVKRVFGCGEKSFAEITAPGDDITLSCVLEVGTDINESHIAAMLAKIIKSKNNLLEEGLAEIYIKPELVFIEPTGKIQISAIDARLEIDLFSDIVAIFRSLLQRRTSSSNGEDTALSKTLLDLINLIDKLSKLKHTGNLHTLHPKHREIWEKIVKHSFIKQKFQRQVLEDIYNNTLARLKTSTSEGKLPFQKLQSESMVVDRICWKPEEGIPSRKYLTSGRVETSDSSGGSSNSHAIGLTTIETPANGSQEWKVQRDKQNSQIFQESCKSVIEDFIAKTKKESTSNFLVSALENLMQTLVSCEDIHPNKTEAILKELIQSKN